MVGKASIIASSEETSLDDSILLVASLHAVAKNNTDTRSTTFFMFILLLFNHSSADFIHQAFLTQISNDFIKYAIDERRTFRRAVFLR